MIYKGCANVLFRTGDLIKNKISKQAKINGANALDDIIYGFVLPA